MKMTKLKNPIPTLSINNLQGLLSYFFYYETPPPSHTVLLQNPVFKINNTLKLSQHPSTALPCHPIGTFHEHFSCHKTLVQYIT